MPLPDFSDARWIKSSYSGQNGNCVELAAAGPVIGVRDSKLGSRSPILRFTRAELQAFLDGVRNDEFDHLI
jgi:hypothetical protein